VERCLLAVYPLSSDALVRLLVVLLAAVLVVLVARFRPRLRGSSLRVEGSLKSPGAYLFTATACDSCDAARSAYVKEMGESGFTELTWEDHPDTLTRLGVTEIPAGSVLDAHGREVGSFVGVPRRRALRRAVRRMRA